MQPGRKVGYEKEALKPDIQPAGGIPDRGSLRFTRKHRVDDSGMTLRKNPQCALHQGLSMGSIHEPESTPLSS